MQKRFVWFDADLPSLCNPRCRTFGTTFADLYTSHTTRVERSLAEQAGTQSRGLVLEQLLVSPMARVACPFTWSLMSPSPKRSNAENTLEKRHGKHMIDSVERNGKHSTLGVRQA